MDPHKSAAILMWALFGIGLTMVSGASLLIFTLRRKPVSLPHKGPLLLLINEKYHVLVYKIVLAAFYTSIIALGIVFIIASFHLRKVLL